MRLFPLLLMTSSLFAGDHLSVGLRAGLPFGDAFETADSGRFKLAGHNRFLIGPTVELRLPAGIGVSFDILYRRYNFETQAATGNSSNGSGQWEFPLMLRYHFPGIVVRPFVGGGPTFQKLTGITTPKSSTAGLALGAGLDIKVPLFHITPEVRYTRRFSDVGAGTISSILKANSNQFDLVVGFTF